MIPFSKYVSITSGVGGASQVANRELIGRIFSESLLISADSVLEFNSADDVSSFFGASSDEAARAAFYFDYVSASISAPQKLSFSSFAPSGRAPRVYGGPLPSSLAQLQAVIAGTIKFNFGASTVTLTAIDFSTAVSLAQVATLLTAEFAADADPNVAATTVSYDATNNRFVIAGSLLDLTSMSFDQIGAGVTDVGAKMGLYTSLGAINVTGVAAAQTPLEALQASINISNNFGSFVFSSELTISEHGDIAEYNSGLNVLFQYMVPVALADYVSWSAALIGYAGTGLTLSVTAGEFPEMVPMIQLAATDYLRRNATVNYMFKQFALTPSVTTEALSDALDAARVNYYGATQTAGQTLAFYQRGVLMGAATDPLDMNVYANEQWLKDSVGASLMSLLLGTGRVPANEEGRLQILSVVQDSIDLAIFNGTISIGKTLTTAQRLFVTQQTGDDLAWHQIQGLGYWVDAVIQSYVAESGITEYKAVYSLLYSKDDAIRFVSGTHSLI